MSSHLALIEFPADDAARARSFWSGLLDVALEPRTAAQGEGWQTGSGSSGDATGSAAAIGVHPRGRGPGDSFSLPYFEVPDMQDALARVASLGGSVVHPGERWAICKDSEGNPFGLALGARARSV
jgi:predicted enzyme related to lactoylglutathione lyase